MRDPTETNRAEHPKVLDGRSLSLTIASTKLLHQDEMKAREGTYLFLLSSPLEGKRSLLLLCRVLRFRFFRDSFLSLLLQLPHLGINATSGQQGFVPSSLYDATVLDDQNLVSIDHS